MTSNHFDGSETKFERAISYLLITGVLVSLFLEVIGVAVFYGSSGHLEISQNEVMFVRGENFFNFIYALFQGEHPQDNGILLMTLGITILILTPFARVVLSVVYFSWEKNIKYVLITLFVLVILTISLAIR